MGLQRKNPKNPSSNLSVMWKRIHTRLILESVTNRTRWKYMWIERSYLLELGLVLTIDRCETCNLSSLLRETSRRLA